MQRQGAVGPGVTTDETTIHQLYRSTSIGAFLAPCT